MLFVGDDWAEAHHDVEFQDESGRVLTRRRLPEGVAGIAQLHALVADHLPGDAEPDQVVVGIETDRGPWVQALLAAGYAVSRSTRCRRRGTGSATSPPGPRAIPATRMCSPIWCALTATSTARSPATLSWPRRSRCWLGPTRT
jgi:hypothetical protein